MAAGDKTADFPSMSSRDEQQRVYSEQVAQGKSHEYALAYASKLHEGEVFARHFALIRFD